MWRLRVRIEQPVPVDERRDVVEGGHVQPPPLEDLTSRGDSDDGGAELVDDLGVRRPRVGEVKLDLLACLAEVGLTGSAAGFASAGACSCSP
jgi:hypothetical protein